MLWKWKNQCLISCQVLEARASPLKYPYLGLVNTCLAVSHVLWCHMLTSHHLHVSIHLVFSFHGMSVAIDCEVSRC